MNCREAGDLVVDLIDARLDTPTQVRLHDHLTGCRDCRERARSLGREVPSMRAAVPPLLDDMRVRRMEVAIERARAVPSGGGRNPWRRPAGAALAVLAAAFMVAVWWRGPSLEPRRSAGEPAASVRGSSGGAVLAREGDAGVPLAAGSALSWGDTITVGGGGRITFALARGSMIDLTGPARMKLAGSAAAVELGLAGGILTAEVTHRRADETFAVALPGARLIVRGTRFTVASRATGSWVRVEEGRVAVLTTGPERLVTAGQLVNLPVATAEAQEPAPAPPSVATGIASAVTAEVVETGCERRRRCEGTARLVRAAIRGGAYQRALSSIAAAGEPPSSDPRDPCAAAQLSCRNELGYLKAEALRLDGRMNRAIAAYRDLDRRGASPATRQNALYAAAQLEQQAGDHGAAGADYQRALAAAPEGALAEESLLGAMDSAARQGTDGLARALARKYLARFPAGTAAPRARRIVSAPSTAPAGAAR